MYVLCVYLFLKTTEAEMLFIKVKDMPQISLCGASEFKQKRVAERGGKIVMVSISSHSN